MKCTPVLKGDEELDTKSAIFDWVWPGGGGGFEGVLPFFLFNIIIYNLPLCFEEKKKKIFILKENEKKKKKIILFCGGGGGGGGGGGCKGSVPFFLLNIMICSSPACSREKKLIVLSTRMFVDNLIIDNNTYDGIWYFWNHKIIDEYWVFKTHNVYRFKLPEDNNYMSHVLPIHWWSDYN